MTGLQGAFNHEVGHKTLWHMERDDHEMVCSVRHALHGGWQLHITYDGRDFYDQYCHEYRDATASGIELIDVLAGHGWHIGCRRKEADVMSPPAPGGPGD
jgi:hypothetical protein